MTVNCAPVLDVPVEGAHDIIGDRAYSLDPATVIKLGRATIEGYLEGGVLPVIKHIPGHGRATADSHLSLPRVATAARELSVRDFVTFRALNHAPIAMTAHVVYEAIDPRRPATTSPRVVRDIVRGEIAFEGLLVSDDLSMAALEGPLSARTKAALFAGCDIALHCNGKLDEMIEVARRRKSCRSGSDRAEGRSTTAQARCSGLWTARGRLRDMLMEPRMRRVSRPSPNSRPPSRRTRPSSSTLMRRRAARISAAPRRNQRSTSRRFSVLQLAEQYLAFMEWPAIAAGTGGRTIGDAAGSLPQIAYRAPQAETGAGPDPRKWRRRCAGGCSGFRRCATQRYV